MHRRELLKLAVLTAGAATTRTLLAEPAPPEPAKVTRVLVVSKCHLDVGFIDTQANIIRKYFDVYYPAAMATAATLRQSGPDHYTWTTGSWLLYQYLEQATPAQRRAMEQAIAAGDIAWHAIPFSWQTELLDPTLIAGGLSLSAALDSRFGKKTTGSKMSDVPGHTRGIISPLAAAGVRLLDIGVNAASTPPEVLPIFLWRDPAGADIVMVYHHHNYGGVVPIPGTTTVFAMEMANDNAGPHSLDEIRKTFDRLRAQFPNATIQAATLSDVAAATEPIRSQLPIVTQEIGDTWIYGVPSDPPKLAAYREVSRLRRQWLRDKKFAAGDATDRKLLGRFLLDVEHTWGTDTKTYLDHDHYTPHDLQLALADPVKFPGYKTMVISWQEKRDNTPEAIATLPGALRTQAEQSLKQLTPQVPSHAGLQPLSRSQTGPISLESRHYALAIDPQTGAIVGLKNRKTGKEWASPTRPLALFTYQTLSAEDFARFLDTYVQSKEWWAPQDFGKPNIEHFGARSAEWHPTLTQAWTGAAEKSHRLLLELKTNIKPEDAQITAPPATIYLDLTLPDDEPVIHLTLSTFDKPENRLPEAMWLTFAPDAPQSSGWVLEKSGQSIRIADVVRGGNRNMHSIAENIRYADPSGSFELATLDAPVVALGQRSPLNFSLDLPVLTSGIHINLFNNAWGTNYPQWCGGSWLYRFTLRA